MKRAAHTTESVKIWVPGPRFFSARDEDGFFSWLKSVRAVRAVKGVHGLGNYPRKQAPIYRMVKTILRIIAVLLLMGAAMNFELFPVRLAY